MEDEIGGSFGTCVGEEKFIEGFGGETRRKEATRKS